MTAALKRVLVTIGVLVAALVPSPASAAPPGSADSAKDVRIGRAGVRTNLNLVNPIVCIFSSNEYLELHYEFSAYGRVEKVCYANAGDLHVDRYGVVRFVSGNNAGSFTYEPGDGWMYRHTFPKWENIAKRYGIVVDIHVD